MFGFEAGQQAKLPQSTSSREVRPPERSLESVIDLTEDSEEVTTQKAALKPRGSITLSNCNLTSVRQLRDAVTEEKHEGVYTKFREQKFDS